MDIVKIVSISLCSLIIIILLKKFNSDYATLASGVISISICFFSFGILIPVFDFVKSISNNSQFGSLYALMLKSTGICLMCSFAAELCRDCSEGQLGTKIEFAGKCTLIAFCLPLIKKVIENATSFMD